MTERVVEAYVGEYASGKSENAINRAVELAKKGKKVILADLDLVEPFYTLRPLKEKLKAKNIEVIAWNTGQVLGLGETGSVLKPELRWILIKKENIILDIGYGVEGTKVLNLLEGIKDNDVLKIYAVINASRPVTSDPASIKEHIAGLGKIHGLINNTHLGDETTIEVIQEGAQIVSEAADRISLPVMYTAAEERFRPELGKEDICGNPVKYITRYMKNAFW